MAKKIESVMATEKRAECMIVCPSCDTTNFISESGTYECEYCPEIFVVSEELINVQVPSASYLADSRMNDFDKRLSEVERQLGLKKR